MTCLFHCLQRLAYRFSLQQVMNLIYGPEVQNVRLSLAHHARCLMTLLPYQWLKSFRLILAAAFAATVVIFMTKSRMGQAIRATAQDARAARVLGIDTDNVSCFTFALNAQHLWRCWRSCFNDLGAAAFLRHRLFPSDICYCDCRRPWQFAGCDWHELRTWLG